MERAASTKAAAWIVFVAGGVLVLGGLLLSFVPDAEVGGLVVFLIGAITIFLGWSLRPGDTTPAEPTQVAGSRGEDLVAERVADGVVTHTAEPVAPAAPGSADAEQPDEWPTPAKKLQPRSADAKPPSPLWIRWAVVLCIAGPAMWWASYFVNEVTCLTLDKRIIIGTQACSDYATTLRAGFGMLKRKDAKNDGTVSDIEMAIVNMVDRELRVFEVGEARDDWLTGHGSGDQQKEAKARSAADVLREHVSMPIADAIDDRVSAQRGKVDGLRILGVFCLLVAFAFASQWLIWRREYTLSLQTIEKKQTG